MDLPTSGTGEEAWAWHFLKQEPRREREHSLLLQRRRGFRPLLPLERGHGLVSFIEREMSRGQAPSLERKEWCGFGHLL